MASTLLCLLLYLFGSGSLPRPDIAGSLQLDALALPSPPLAARLRRRR